MEEQKEQLMPALTQSILQSSPADLTRSLHDTKKSKSPTVATEFSAHNEVIGTASNQTDAICTRLCGTWSSMLKEPF